MEQFLNALRMAGKVMPTLGPIVSALVPQLAPVIKVAELLAKAGQDAAPQAALVVQILGGTPLTAEQKAQQDAAYERLGGNLMRPADPPPGSA